MNVVAFNFCVMHLARQFYTIQESGILVENEGI